MLTTIRADPNVTNGLALGSVAALTSTVFGSTYEGAVRVTRGRLEGTHGLGSNAFGKVRRTRQEISALGSTHFSRNSIYSKGRFVVIASGAWIAVVRPVRRCNNRVKIGNERELDFVLLLHSC